MLPSPYPQDIGFEDEAFAVCKPSHRAGASTGMLAAVGIKLAIVAFQAAG